MLEQLLLVLLVDLLISLIIFKHELSKLTIVVSYFKKGMHNDATSKS